MDYLINTIQLIEIQFITLINFINRIFGFTFEF